METEQLVQVATSDTDSNSDGVPQCSLPAELLMNEAAQQFIAKRLGDFVQQGEEITSLRIVVACRKAAEQHADCSTNTALAYAIAQRDADIEALHTYFQLEYEDPGYAENLFVRENKPVGPDLTSVRTAAEAVLAKTLPLNGSSAPIAATSDPKATATQAAKKSVFRERDIPDAQPSTNGTKMLPALSARFEDIIETLQVDTGLSTEDAIRAVAEVITEKTGMRATVAQVKLVVTHKPALPHANAMITLLETAKHNKMIIGQSFLALPKAPKEPVVRKKRQATSPVSAKPIPFQLDVHLSPADQILAISDAIFHVLSRKATVSHLHTILEQIEVKRRAILLNILGDTHGGKTIESVMSQHTSSAEITSSNGGGAALTLDLSPLLKGSTPPKRGKKKGTKNGRSFDKGGTDFDEDTQDEDFDLAGSLPEDGAGDEEENDALGYSAFELMSIDPYRPTKAKPGTERKVMVVAARYAAGLPLWHQEDCYEHGPKDLDFTGHDLGVQYR